VNYLVFENAGRAPAQRQFYAFVVICLAAVSRKRPRLLAVGRVDAALVPRAGFA
jgi:hypothetical protein